MKSFKKFFEAGQKGDINIVAQPPNGRPEALGQTDDDGKDKIARYINKFNLGGDNDIKQLIDDSDFRTEDYYKMFSAEINDETKFVVDWDAFKDHVHNRFEQNKLEEVFTGPYGEFPLDQYAVNIISRFIKNDPYAFFERMMTMAYQVRGTAVGGGEFILGILGNGRKGQKGDVDIPNGHLQTTGDKPLVLEIGTQMKIIGKSTREVGAAPGSADIIYSTALAPLQYNPDWERPEATEANEEIPAETETGVIQVDSEKQRRATILEQLENFKHITPADRKYIYELLTSPESRSQINLGTGKYLQGGAYDVSTGTGSHISRIVGTVVLYEYMVEHGDDVIVSINSGTAAVTQLDPYWTRYAKIGEQHDMGFRNVLELVMGKGWYNFQIQPAAVKFTLGAKQQRQ